MWHAPAGRGWAAGGDGGAPALRAVGPARVAFLAAGGALAGSPQPGRTAVGGDGYFAGVSCFSRNLPKNGLLNAEAAFCARNGRQSDGGGGAGDAAGIAGGGGIAAGSAAGSSAGSAAGSAAAAGTAPPGVLALNHAIDTSFRLARRGVTLLPYFEVRRFSATDFAAAQSGALHACADSPAARYFRCAFRAARLALLLFPAVTLWAARALAYQVQRAADQVRWAPALSAARAAAAAADALFLRYLAWGIPAAGPCYVKLAQWAATRADLFPASVCRICAAFQARNRPHPFPYTALALREAFGEAYQDCMQVVPEPLGVGSIAQVHKAVLFPQDGRGGTAPIFAAFQAARAEQRGAEAAAEGRGGAAADYAPVPVAIKVLHPYVAFELRTDLLLMRAAAGLFESVIPAGSVLGLREGARQFSDAMLEQLDFRREAENTRRFAANFAKRNSVRIMRRHCARVVFPVVLSPSPGDKEPACLMQSFESGTLLGKWMDRTRERPNDSAAAHAAHHKLKYISEHYADGAPGSVTLPSQHPPPLALNKRVAAIVRSLTRTTLDRIRAFTVSAAVYLRLKPPPSARLKGGAESWHAVGDAGLASFLQMIFLDNFIHADLHPGNIMVRFAHETTERRPSQESSDDSSDSSSDGLNGSRDSECSWPSDSARASPSFPREVAFDLIFLDSGLTASLSRNEYFNFCDLLRSTCTGDGYTAGRLILERSRNAAACQDPEGFKRRVAALVAEHYNAAAGSLQLNASKIGEVLCRMLQLSHEARVQLEPRFVNLLVAIVVLEGVGRQLNPDVDLLGAALPFAKEVLLDSCV